MQTSSKSVRFPQADRFKLVYKKPLSDNIFKLKSTLSSRSTTQGYSSKWDMSKTTKKVPPPGNYNLSGTSFFNKYQGASIGHKLPIRVFLYYKIFKFIL